MSNFRMSQIWLSVTLVLTLVAGAVPAGASTNTTGGNIQHVVGILAPANLRLPANAADCVNHVYLHGAGYYEHAAYGCSHPTANYVILIWDYTRHVDGFHIWRTDGTRQDYGIHNDGTMAQIYYPGGHACYVVTAVIGNQESPDSNQYCLNSYIAPNRLVIPH
jgi:hypothetical protein